MDDGKLKKPAHIKEHTWKRHLSWMELVGKQANEKIKRRKKHIDNDFTQIIRIKTGQATRMLQRDHAGINITYSLGRLPARVGRAVLVRSKR